MSCGHTRSFDKMTRTQGEYQKAEDDCNDETSQCIVFPNPLLFGDFSFQFDIVFIDFGMQGGSGQVQEFCRLGTVAIGYF